MHTTRRSAIARTAAPLGAALLVTACGGGGPVAPDLDALRADPRIMRLERILESADTLNMSTIHRYLQTTVGEMNFAQRITERMHCDGARCESEDGDLNTIEMLVDPEEEAFLTSIVFGERDGFDSVRTTVGIDVDTIGEDLPIERPDEAGVEYGLWGRYGYASVGIVDATFSNVSADTSGRFRSTTTLATGDASISAPTGVGAARWRGPLEAVTVESYEHRRGTVELAIDDLADPRLAVSLDIAGERVSPAAWHDIPVDGAAFEAGAPESVDHIAGSFHGPAHEEVYGVFETSIHIGAFAASRSDTE